jgi:putative membrane protein insertion efficiency factor
MNLKRSKSHYYIKTDFNLYYYLCLIMKLIRRILVFFLSLPVIVYRYSISPFLRPSCRHVPSCSQFMLDALKIHGPLTGLLMGTGRILRCRPGGTHGYDPVPLFRFRRYKPFTTLHSRIESENRLKR